MRPASDMEGTHLKYRPDIDGLRAVAVLSVLFYHAQLGCSGGFVGVDIFFVISGYLITGLILKGMKTGRFNLIEFWTRRLRRIFPALCIVVAASLVAGWFFFLPADFARLGQSICAQSLLVSNIYFYCTTPSGYFKNSVETMPLLHTWSLAVEEQFYLFFPLLLLAPGHLARKLLWPVLATLAILSFGACVYGSHTHASANFYFLPTRMWELLIGAMTTMLVLKKEPPLWLCEFLAWSGCVLILVAVFFYDGSTLFPGLAALSPCLGAALIIWINGARTTSVGRLLALPSVVFVGLISYSLYLWHWPLLAFTRYLLPYPPTVIERSAVLLVSGIFATVSWRLIEVPFRKRLVFFRPIQIWLWAGIATAVLIMAGFLINQFGGVPARLPAQARTYAHAGEDPEGIFATELSVQQAQNGRFAEIGVNNDRQPIDLALWGDSHAMVLQPLLKELCWEHSIRAVVTSHVMTLPLVNYASNDDFNNEWLRKKSNIAFNASVLKFIRDHRIKNVILAGKWDNMAASQDEARRCLIQTLASLKNFGCNIWIFREVPSPSVNVPQVLALAVVRRIPVANMSVSAASYLNGRALQDRLFEGISAADAQMVDPSPFFLNKDGRVIIESNGQSLFADEDHISVSGAMRLRPLFEPIFDRIEKTDH